MRPPRYYAQGPHPPALPDSPREEWWIRPCPNRFVAAYQAGRLLNQLNWHCQLAVLISQEEHRQAIGVVVSKLKSVSQELVQNAPSRAEKRIDRSIDRFWEAFSSYWSVEVYEDLAEELKLSDELPEDYGPPDMTSERACCELNDVFVEPIMAAIRKQLKRGLDSSERWAFGLGEYLDGGMRRTDVSAFVNRHPPPEVVEEEAWDNNGQSEADFDDEEDEADYFKNEERTTEAEQTPAQLDDLGKNLSDVGFAGDQDQSRKPIADDEQPPFDGFVNRHFANYQPVPGSILPEPAWDQQVLELASRVGIEKALRRHVLPVPINATAEDVIRTVAQADEGAFAALRRLKRPWYHGVNEPRPTQFKFGAIKGQKLSLAASLGFGDHRTFATLARADNAIWVTRLSRFEFELHFVCEVGFKCAAEKTNVTKVNDDTSTTPDSSHK